MKSKFLNLKEFVLVLLLACLETVIGLVAAMPFAANLQLVYFLVPGLTGFDEMGVRPNVKYTAREDRTILAMVSKGLGISLLPELMVRHSPYPVTACRPPMTFYRNIGIAVKDEKALSASTRRFVEYVRGWVAENGGK